jgi:hypothetical protein
MFPGKLGPKDGAKLAYFVLAFSVLWTTVAFLTSGRDYLALQKALKGGNVDIVEGRVENFVSTPDKSERFTVCGAAFSYSDYLVTAGFNNTSSHGGPIREGIWVRIAYLGNSMSSAEPSNKPMKLSIRPQGHWCTIEGATRRPARSLSAGR